MRAAIDALPKEHLPFSMSGFPAGACGDTSILLGAYLVDCGHTGFEYICGTRGSQEEGLPLTWGAYRGSRIGLFTFNATKDAGYVDIDQVKYPIEGNARALPE